jgi:NADH-quinone oxidoreductase E subunit
MQEKIKNKIIEISSKYPRKESALMPALTMVQKESSNFLSDADIKEVAKLLGVSDSKAFGVASYYTMYNLRSVGKYHLQVDTNIPGFLTGANEILEHLKEKLNLSPGETTEDGLFTVSYVEDLGSCGTCPVVQVNETYYENMNIEKVDQLVEALKQGELPAAETTYNFATECNVLLKNRGVENATEIAIAKSKGAYKALEKALAMQPEQIVQEVKDAGVRGRGGAGFPAGVKWGFLPKADPRPVYLICNADEGEPGTFKDRQIMEYDPHLLIEGIAITAYALGSEKAFIYIRGEFAWISDILEKAIEQAKEDGQLGNVDIIVHSGAGSYVCGEETALIESIEGKRGCPRNKPPFPANVGLYDCPTIVNNVETLASVPFIIENSAAAYKEFGTEGNFGPKLYGVSGQVMKPGVYEFPMGTLLGKILDMAGGVKGKLKAVIVGGLSVPILKADEIKGLKMDFDSCQKAGTMLGSGGVMVINDTVSIPELALRTIKFYAHESCGQCVPCREGAHIIVELLKKILNKKGSKKDIDLILHICKNTKGLTLCPTGEAFAMPIEAMINKFRNEFEALVA